MSTQTLPTQAQPPGAPAPRDDRGTRAALRLLAVGVGLLLVAYGAVSVASLLARATETRSGTFAGVRGVDLDLSFEKVEIVGSPTATQVTMTRRWHWSLAEPDVVTRRTGDRLVLTSSCPFTPGMPCTGWVRLTVPAGTSVSGGSSDGHVTVRDVSGNVDLSGSDGSITVSGLGGPVRLHTSDGSIDGTGLRSGTVAADTSDGSVHLVFAAPPRQVAASTSDGSVEVRVPDDGTAYDVSASTGNGARQVSVPTDPHAHRRITVRSRDGAVRVLTHP